MCKILPNKYSIVNSCSSVKSVSLELSDNSLSIKKNDYGIIFLVKKQFNNKTPKTFQSVR